MITATAFGSKFVIKAAGRVKKD